MSPAEPGAAATAPPSKTRVAILGGGAGAMAAAYALTNTPELRARFDVTVYQLGWRLGGKGASGRNRKIANRIEEHGVHVWGGFYENAFAMMRQVYAELGRKPGEPLATIDEAFTPQSFTTTQEYVDGRWVSWDVDYPTNGRSPGTGDEPPSLHEYAWMAVQFMVEVALGPAVLARLQELDEPSLKSAGTLPSEIHGALGVLAAGTGPHPDHPVEVWMLSHALSLAKKASGGRFDKLILEAVLWLVTEFMQLVSRVLAPVLDRVAAARHAFIALDLAASQLRGAVRDGVFEDGLGTIDHLEWRDWMRNNGASDVTLQSSIVRAMYDYVFAYRGGDASMPCASAAVMFNALARNALTYKGAVLWKMNAGMGDVVFAPLYLVLKQRGVRFEFFRRVQALELDPTGTHVQRVRLNVQATLAPGVSEYDPLYPVNRLPCWPSEPLYEQLAQGRELQDRRVDLESSWSGWPGVGEEVLERGVQFDDVVLGISVGGLPGITQELAKASGAWRDMLANVATVQTQALQLWLTPDLAALGRRPVIPTICCGYVQPLDTWADMSHLIDRETWPANARPGSIHYFCGPMRAVTPEPPYSDTAFPETQLRRVETTSRAWLQGATQHLWPAAVDADADPTGLDWDLLVDLRTPPGTGEARLESQYIRANIDPTERYVQSLPGTAKYRLASDGSGFANLYLAGDWVRTQLNAGCIEAAVVGGLAAARGVAKGEGVPIRGEGVAW